MRITVERHISQEAADDFFGFYHDAFEPLLTESAVAQTVDLDEFRHYAASEDVIKFVGRDGDRPVALSLVTQNLQHIKWINEPFWAQRYPAHHSRDAIYYFITLVVAPDHQDGGLIHAMIEAIGLYIGLDRGVIAFDCCQYNIDHFAVPQMIEALGSTHVYVDCQEIDAQRYYGYEVTGIKTLDLRDTKDHGVDIDLTDQHRVGEPAHGPEGAP